MRYVITFLVIIALVSIVVGCSKEQSNEDVAQKVISSSLVSAAE
jgi:hypothetical protein